MRKIIIFLILLLTFINSIFATNTKWYDTLLKDSVDHYYQSVSSDFGAYEKSCVKDKYGDDTDEIIIATEVLGSYTTRYIKNGTSTVAITADKKSIKFDPLGFGVISTSSCEILDKMTYKIGSSEYIVSFPYYSLNGKEHVTRIFRNLMAGNDIKVFMSFIDKYDHKFSCKFSFTVPSRGFRNAYLNTFGSLLLDAKPKPVVEKITENITMSIIDVYGPNVTNNILYEVYENHYESFYTDIVVCNFKNTTEKTVTLGVDNFAVYQTKGKKYYIQKLYDSCFIWGFSKYSGKFPRIVVNTDFFLDVKENWANVELAPGESSIGVFAIRGPIWSEVDSEELSCSKKIVYKKKEFRDSTLNSDVKQGVLDNLFIEY